MIERAAKKTSECAPFFCQSGRRHCLFFCGGVCGSVVVVGVVHIFVQEVVLMYAVRIPRFNAQPVLLAVVDLSVLAQII